MTIIANSGLLAPFNVNQLPNVWGWWDGADPNGTGILPSNGSSVSLFKNKARGGSDFTQASGANQPTFSSNAKNNRGGLVFPTSGQTMTTVNPPNLATFGNNPRSLILVLSINSALSGYNSPFSQGGGGNGNNFIFGQFNAGGSFFGIDSGGSGLYMNFTTTSISQNTFYIWEYYNSNGNLLNANAFVNGVSQAITNHGYSGGVVASSGISLGGAGGTTVLEVIASNNQFNSAQASQVRYYLRGKWGI